MIFTKYPNDFWHKRKIDIFDPNDVLLAIATNILQQLKTGFVLQGHTFTCTDVHLFIYWFNYFVSLVVKTVYGLQTLSFNV